MKINKWTLALAAAGLVSLASVAQAEETPLLTALSSTQISGYVDVSAQWNPGTGAVGPAYSFAKRDGFSVDSVLVSIQKPLEEGEWSAGYQIDLMFGPDAAGVNVDGTAGNDNLRQAFVALRAPVGNGLDFKLGRWDTILGYESTDSYKNPNFTRSYGYTLTPTEHTGILATYQAVDFLALNLGVANTAATGLINGRAPIESQKTYLASATITAPESWGFLSGSTLSFGVIDGFGGGPKDLTDYYVGATLSTGVEGLKVGADYNFFDDPAVVGVPAGADTYTTALYVSFKATEKLSLHARGEYGHGAALPGLGAPSRSAEVVAATATVQYDLWENVLSRVELRWDHDASGSAVRPFSGKRNDFLVAANIVYKF